MCWGVQVGLSGSLCLCVFCVGGVQVGLSRCLCLRVFVIGGVRVSLSRSPCLYMLLCGKCVSRPFEELMPSCASCWGRASRPACRSLCLHVLLCFWLCLVPFRSVPFEHVTRVPTHSLHMPFRFVPLLFQGQDWGWCSTIPVVKVEPCNHPGPCVAGAVICPWPYIRSVPSFPHCQKFPSGLAPSQFGDWQQTGWVMHARSSPSSGCSL